MFYSTVLVSHCITEYVRMYLRLFCSGRQVCIVDIDLNSVFLTKKNLRISEISKKVLSKGSRNDRLTEPQNSLSRLKLPLSYLKSAGTQ